MENILIVVDMQNDFISGTLGTKEAELIVDNAVKKIEKFNGTIFATYDTHFENYSETREGRNLPVKHCIKGTLGWELNNKIKAILDKKGYTAIEKTTFGSDKLPKKIENLYGSDISIELIGLCTDICVVSNALLLRASFPEADISVDASCCAGVTADKHKMALEVMKSCQINVINE